VIRKIIERIDEFGCGILSEFISSWAIRNGQVGFSGTTAAGDADWLPADSDGVTDGAGTGNKSLLERRLRRAGKAEIDSVLEIRGT